MANSFTSDERRSQQWEKLLRDELLCYKDRDEVDSYFNSGCTFLERNVSGALNRINERRDSAYCRMFPVWDYAFVDCLVVSFRYFYCEDTDNFFHQFQWDDFASHNFQTFDWRWLNGNEDGWYLCSSYLGLCCAGSSCSS